MTRRIPQDPNYRTPCPAAIKAKITTLENAALEYAFAGAQPPEDREGVLHDAQTARYNLEQTILTCIKAAEDEARKAREADTARRAAVRTAIAEEIRAVLGLVNDDEDPAFVLMDEIMAGRIPHVKVEM